MTADSIRLEVRGPLRDEIVLTLRPRPTLIVTGLFDTSAIELDPSAVDGLLSQIEGLQIPAAPSSGPMGLDGYTFTLRFEDASTASEYSWWSEPPPGWEALAEIASNLIALTGRKIPSTGY